MKNTFDEFWALYPKKCNKKKAELKWNKLDDETKTIILQDLQKRSSGSKWLAGYIEHPTTYLNGERWNDEIVSQQINRRGSITLSL